MPDASMLLAFRAENARSFRDPVELSLLATRLSDPETVREIPWRDEGRPIGVLPVGAIFGANASGKSNILRAMNDMRSFVLFSFRLGHPDGRIPVQPFRLAGEDDEAPSRYEIDLVLEGVRHEYGFVLSRKRILQEWAQSYPHGRKLLLFRRKGQEVDLGRAHRTKGRATQEILREDALFVSTAAATSHPGLLPLHDWFRRNLLFADDTSRAARQALTAEMLEREGASEQVLSLLREADLGITGATKREVDPEIRERLQRAVDVLEGKEGDAEGAEMSVEFEDFELRLKHKAGLRDVELRPDEESRGTLIWFGMIGPVLEALQDGSVLLADELDASLHPTLVNALVRLFQSKRSNPKRAQFIFNSHDVTLMGDASNHPLSRDQIWFSEKDEDGGTHLYPLTDLDPRREEALARRYLAGRYGATPIVSLGRLEDIGEAISTSDDGEGD